MPRRLLAGLVVLVFLVSLLAIPATAHHTSTTNGYDLIYGVNDHDVHVGQWVYLEVGIFDGDGTAVSGLEDSMEWTVVPAGAEPIPLEIRPMYSVPGWYEASVTFTRSGWYEFHIKGTIGQTELDERWDVWVAPRPGLELRDSTSILVPSVETPAMDRYGRLLPRTVVDLRHGPMTYLWDAVGANDRLLAVVILIAVGLVAFLVRRYRG